MFCILSEWEAMNFPMIRGSDKDLPRTLLYVTCLPPRICFDLLVDKSFPSNLPFQMNAPNWVIDPKNALCFIWFFPVIIKSGKIVIHITMTRCKVFNNMVSMTKFIIFYSEKNCKYLPWQITSDSNYWKN